MNKALRVSLPVLLSVLAFGATAPLAFASSGNTYYVNPDGSDTACNGSANVASTTPPACAFATIGQAITTAVDGDTINVAAGNYAENITIHHQISLLGPNDIINPNGAGARATEAVITGEIKDYASSSKIDGFTFTNPDYSGGNTITGVHIYSAGPTISNIEVKNNIFTNIKNSAAKGSYAVMVQGDMSGVDVSDNKIDGITSAGWAHAIEVTPTCNSTNVPRSVTISGNVISNVTNTAGNDEYGFTLDSCDASNVADASQVAFHNNMLNGVGIRNLDQNNILDATDNYWGSASGPATDISNVNYRPWYTDPTMTTTATGITIGTTQYNTIQAAVAAAAPSDTISLAAGTYELGSQIRINKGVTITGAGDSTVITKSSPAWTNSTGSKGYAPLIAVSGATDPVVLQDFKVTGAATILMTPSCTVSSCKDYGHGINVVSSSNVTLNNVTSTSNAAAGLIVNSSNVTANNLNTSGNGWYAVNVDQQDSGPASFTLTGNGVLAEDVQIDSDKTVGATVAADGYTAYKMGGGTVTLWSNRPLTNVASITEGSVTNYYTSIQAAVNAASTTAIDTINVAPGTYTENVTISTPVILTGASGAKLVVPNVNESNGITVTANNVTIQGLDIEGPANSSYTTYAWGSINTRGIVIKNGVTGFTITNNKIENLRNDILIDGRNTGSVTNNIIDNSKSGISVQYTDGSGITITGNSQGTYGNDWGMNLHLNGYWDGTTIHSNPYPGGAAPTSAQTIINSDSSANGGWTVQDQSYVSANRTAVTVADTGTPTAQGDPLGPISTIQNGIAAVVPGGTVNVTAGSYAENVTVNNSVHLLGPNAMVNPNTTATRNTEATLTGTIVDYAGNTDIKGFTITDPSYGGGTIKGIHIYSAGPVISNINVENNIFSNITNSQAHGSYGVMVQGVVSNVNVSDNKLDGITSAGWAHAIEVTPTANASAVPQNVTVDGNSFSDVSSSNVTPDAYAFSNDWDSDTNNYADASQVTFHNNSLGGLMVRNLDAATSTLDATNNWWGSATSPASQVSAGVNYTPWYADAGMKALSSGGSTVTVSSGNFVPQTSSGTATLPTGTSDLKMGGGSTLDLSDATVATSSSATIDGNPAVALTKTVTLNSGTSGAITLSNTDSSVAATASIPDGTTISGPSGWDGTIAPPTSGSFSGTAPSGYVAGGTVISVGSGDSTLVFSNPVTILLTGVTTGAVGYKPAGSDTWTVINGCGGSYDNPTPPASPGACVAMKGSDAKILTYHFTTFGSLAFQNSSSNSNSGGGGGGGGAIAIVPNNTVTTPTTTTTPAPATAAQGQVLGAAVYNFAKNLGVGSRGADVTALQQYLLDNGFSIPAGATGYYGAQTRAAVIAFQKAHGIEQAGVVGPQTRAELNKGVVATTPETTPVAAGKTNLTAGQASAIIGFLQSFDADPSIIANVKAVLGL